MPVDRFLQESLAAGEFDPLLWSREGVGFFYNSARRLENVVPLPQGGAKRAPGLKLSGPQRGLVTNFGSGSWSYAAPNGGTAGNIADATLELTTVTNISTATAYVIATIDLLAATRVTGWQIKINANGLAAGTSITVSIQSSDDAAAYTTRASFNIGSTSYRRVFSLAPDLDLGTHRYWRIIVDNPTGADLGASTITCNSLAPFTEAGYSQAPAAGPPEALARRINVSSEVGYFLVLGQVIGDVYSLTGDWLASFRTPYEDADIPEVRTSQFLDSMIAYHEDRAPFLIQRLGTDTDWQGDTFTFSTVAQFPFANSSTGGQNEIQELSFSGMSAGNNLVFEFNGEITDEVAWSATPATNVTNFTTALESLADITEVTITNPSGNIYEIEFTGVDGKRFFASLIVDILTGTGSVDISRKKYGRPDQEDLWSATRGYPRCGTFYQGRHWMGGFRSRPDILVGSRSGDFTDFKEDAEPVATSPLVLSPDIDEQITIQNLYPGRNLQIFTNSAELFIPNEPITPTNVAIKVTSKRGHFTKTQPVDIQGGTLFVDANGTALREYLFTEVEQSYTAEPISILAGHLVNRPTSMALALSSDVQDPTVLYVVNTGRDRANEIVPMAAIVIDRAQQVTAFARRTTAGTFRAVAAAKSGETLFIVERQLAGAKWNWVETYNENHMGDCSIEIANPNAEQFTATASQTLFTYTFTIPVAADDVQAWTRSSTAEPWALVDQDAYTLDLGAKTVTFDTGLEAGTLVYIAPRQTTAALGNAYLDGIEVFVHCDGRPINTATPASGSVTVPSDDGFFFNCRVGLVMLPNIVLHPYKGKGGRSPTMQKQRIFRALLNVERTYGMAVGIDGRTPRDVAFTNNDTVLLDSELEELLFTGTKRVSGIGGWQTEPSLRITQTVPAPFLLRAVTYDVRF